MSPVGGVGINLAIQDAVAAANILVPAFRRSAIAEGSLRAIQRRRLFWTRVTQRLQIVIQKRVIARVLQGQSRQHMPWVFRQLERYPGSAASPPSSSAWESGRST